MKNKYSISLVIATLGGDSLKKTIATVNNGTIIPTEILVVIPKDNYECVSDLGFANIRIITTKIKGQVLQRLEGFKESKCKFVMQMDDDINLGEDCLERMFKLLIRLGPGNAIGPYYLNPTSLLPIQKFDLGFVGFLKSVNAFIFAAAPWGIARMGKITKLAVTYGTDVNFYNKDICEVEWLPGGCVLNYSQDLVLENYFPFSGKAYSEDIIHSLLRSSKNIIHHVAFQASAVTPLDETSFSSWEDTKSEVNVRLYIIKLLGGNKFRFYIWYFSQLLVRKFTWKK